MVKILIVDKQKSIRNILKERLEFEGHAVETAEDLASAHEMNSELRFDIIISDEEFFYAYIHAGLKQDFHFAIIVTSDSPSIYSAVNAVKHGAFDFLSKPIDMNSLLDSLKRACADADQGEPQVAPAIPQKTRSKRSKGAKDIVGDSPAIRHVKNLIDKVAPSDARVLITGPNGTGKELVAHWLHLKSARSDAPFVEVNCAAIPSELIESELFGHEKGAFTSAIKQRKGKFEQASGGTLFLDEIGDMSLSAQAKVLRALQENRICRVGSDRDISVDVRILAATNKDLRKEIEAGNFREDLYHRLSVILIHVPPLSDRLEDIPLLVNHFVERLSDEYGMPPKPVEPEAIAKLQTLSWTGNIRELHNVVERLLILSDDKITGKEVSDYAMSAF